MLPYVILATLVGLPIVLGLFLRVSAPHIFFSVMAGELLGRYFGHNVEELIAHYIKSEAPAQYAEAIILSLPVIMTAIILKNSLPRAKAIINLVPLIITGVVYASFMLPILPAEVQDKVKALPLGGELMSTTSTVIGVVVLVQLLALWAVERGGENKRRKKDKR